jgi:CPA2 family monovalent cation:H+ antiporter-2
VGTLTRLLLLDVVLLSLLIIGVALEFGPATGALTRGLGIAAGLSEVLVIGFALVVALPLFLGVGRLARQIGLTLGETALPPTGSGVDLEAAPRKALVATLQFGVVLLAGVIVLALTQPVLPSYAGVPILIVLLLGFGLALWRRAADLEGHVRAGAEAVVAALSAQARKERTRQEAGAMSPVESLLHGLGTPVAVRVEPESAAVGRTLSELNLRGRTGATVLAISRDQAAILSPPATERLLANDVLALAGTQDSLEAAKALLTPSAAGADQRGA